MNEPPTAVRIGDSERERATTALGEHLRAGRLDVTEYDARVQLAYAAKTESDIAPLFADLPAGSPLTPVAPAPTRRQRLARARIPRAAFLLLLAGATIAWVTITKFPPLFLFPLLWFVLARGHRPRRLPEGRMDYPRGRRDWH
jgi:hypothetical protein